METQTTVTKNGKKGVSIGGVFTPFDQANTDEQLGREAGRYLFASGNLNPRKVMKFGPELIEAAKSAAEWLCESREGSDQYERGSALLKVIKKIEGRSQ